jgi:hypothetical protein
MPTKITETIAPPKDEPRNRQERRHPDLSALFAELPPWVSRKFPKFKDLIGYSPRSFANMDSLGMTNEIKKIMKAGAICYERESLVAWLEARSRVI